MLSLYKLRQLSAHGQCVCVCLITYVWVVAPQLL